MSSVNNKTAKNIRIKDQQIALHARPRNKIKQQSPPTGNQVQQPLWNVSVRVIDPNIALNSKGSTPMDNARRNGTQGSSMGGGNFL